MARSTFARALAALVLLSGCEADLGRVTAKIEWPPSEPNVARDQNEQLFLPRVPFEVGRLQIVALDVDGNVLDETNLTDVPLDGEFQLDHDGGTWTLDRVPIGVDRQIVGRAYLVPDPDPRLSEQLALEGFVKNVSVRSGEMTNAGTISLFPIDGVRYPPLDRESPDAPEIEVTTPATGDAIAVQITPPFQADVAGYVIVVGPASAIGVPILARGMPVELDTELFPGLLVRSIVYEQDPGTVIVSGLDDGTAYRALVFAFDGDLGGGPLNFSDPGIDSGTPVDTTPPGAAQNLTVVGTPTPRTANISFQAPGEDGDVGTADRYEVRTSTSVEALSNPATFVGLRAAAAPAPLPGGMAVMGQISVDLPGITELSRVFVGVRAIDRAGNVGPIVTNVYVSDPNAIPTIDGLAPQIAIAGAEIEIVGVNLGTAGMITLTETGTSVVVRSLAATRWSDDRIGIRVPTRARSGTLIVRRADNNQTAATYLPVIFRTPQVMQPYLRFELLSNETRIGMPVGAVYRERTNGDDVIGEVQQLAGLALVGPARVPLTSPGSTAIAGTFTRTPVERYYFVSSATIATGLSSVLIRSSTATPAAERLTNAGVGGIRNRVSVLQLPTAAINVVPAMLAVSENNAVRTATTTDARTLRYGRMYTLTPATAGATLDRATLLLAGTTAILAHRETLAGTSRLIVRSNPTPEDADTFTIIPAATPPIARERFELLQADSPLGARTLIIYETLDPNGRSDVRILPLDRYGTSMGYAPFGIPTQDRKLEDAGLVFRGTEIWVALLVSSTNEVRYTEVPLTALELDDTNRGRHPGAVIESATAGNSGRLGCKVPVQSCPLIWNGTTAQALFIRR